MSGPPGADRRRPRTLVAVCTANRPERLAELLAHLAAFAPEVGGPDWSLLVVDNRPGGAAARVVADAAPRLPVSLRYVEEPEAGIASARNRAVREAAATGADFLAFIDDDDLPAPDWLARLLARQAATGAGIVLGAWVLPAGFTVPPLLEKIDFFRPLKPEESTLFRLPLWGGTFNMLAAADVFDRLAADGPPFRPEFSATGGEDTDFLIRADRAGCRVAVAEDSIVVRGWEPARISLGGALRRGFRLGCSQMHLAARHLPGEAFAKMRRKALRRLLRTSLRAVPAMRRPKRLAVILVQIAYRLGELHGARGRRFAYYG